jgi:NAD(P)-dependent dehydrogenase (short-subunit alcohol dehydrogenase family)
VTHDPARPLEGRVAFITGGAGLLGARHAIAIARAGGVPVIADLREPAAQDVADQVRAATGGRAVVLHCDVTDENSVRRASGAVLAELGRVDILVNNAANNPRVESGDDGAFVRVERMTRERWDADVAVGLTGAFLCAKVFGSVMAERRHGAIVNISSEYGIIAPDQRLYEIPGTRSDDQPTKPISYSVVKAGLHGMTTYLAAYWGAQAVRVNTLVVGGVNAGQPADFVARASDRIPLGHMAAPTDFEGALVFLCSDASSFMTGASLVVDGGKSIW